MTPLIREWCSTMCATAIEDAFDPVDLHWFDVSTVISNRFYIDADEQKMALLTMRPPFEKCVVVGRTFEPGVQMDIMQMLIHDEKENVTFISTWRGVGGNMPVSSPTLVFAPKDGLINVGTLDGEEISDHEKRFVMGNLSVFFTSLMTKSQGYVATPKMGYTSRKRVAKGLAPLFEWRTVVIEPQKPSQSLGGTHASPRLHERRGHLRTLSDGRKVWVKPCWVGDANRGTVFHDYKFKETAA